MKLFLNGEAVFVMDGATLIDLLKQIGSPERGVAVERNLEIVPRSRHAAERLCEGDRIEIVQFVGGG